MNSYNINAPCRTRTCVTNNGVSCFQDTRNCRYANGANDDWWAWAGLNLLLTSGIQLRTCTPCKHCHLPMMKWIWEWDFNPPTTRHCAAHTILCREHRCTGIPHVEWILTWHVRGSCKPCLFKRLFLLRTRIHTALVQWLWAYSHTLIHATNVPDTIRTCDFLLPKLDPSYNDAPLTELQILDEY